MTTKNTPPLDPADADALSEAAASADYDTFTGLIKKITVWEPEPAAAKKPAQGTPSAPSDQALTGARGKQREARPAPPPSQDRWPANWGDEYRGIPNELIRSGLFNVRRSERRAMLENETIASLKNTVMLYSGEELRIKDEDVLMQIFHFQRNFNIGEPWQVNGQDFLKSMRWSDGKKGYYELYASLLRLSKGHLSIIRREGDAESFVLEAGVLLSYLKIEHGGRGGETKITIGVNSKTRKLWETMGYTMVNWEQRLKLTSALARYLHRFYSSHQNPIPYRVETLLNLTGSTVESLPKFRQMLNAALAALKEIGFLVSGTIGEDDKVHVLRANILESNPNQNT